ncbi:MAG: c-type cytochrome [Acidobacteriota bacterium]
MTWWIALLFFQAPPQMDLPQVDKNPHTTEPDIAQGRKLFAGRCAGCHGPGGDGGKGANLAVAVLPRASTDLALYRVVRYGLPETEMPATLLAPREVWQIAAFVRALGAASAAESNGGDPARGRDVVTTKGACLQCHAIGLTGGRLGPALTDVGVRRGPGHLRAKLLDSQSAIPDDFRMARVTTRDGRKIEGVRLNEDVDSIQIRDTGGTLHSYWKRELLNFKVERRTAMPSYAGKLSGQEINDAVAYLSTLRGETQ